MKIVSPKELDEILNAGHYKVQVTVGEKVLSETFDTYQIKETHGSIVDWIKILQNRFPGKMLTLQYGEAKGNRMLKDTRRMCQIQDESIHQENHLSETPTIIYNHGSDHISVNGTIRPGDNSEMMRHKNIMLIEFYNEMKSRLDTTKSTLEKIQAEHDSLLKKLDEQERDYQKKLWEVEFEGLKKAQTAELNHSMALAKAQKPSAMEVVERLVTNEDVQAAVMNGLESFAEGRAKGMNAQAGLSEDERNLVSWFRAHKHHAALIVKLLNGISQNEGFVKRLNAFLSDNLTVTADP